MTLHRWILAAGLCVVDCLAQAQGISNVARHAPANCYLAAASRDVSKTCQAFQGTLLGRSLCGPDFRPLIEELRRRDMAGPLHLRPTFGFDWSELAELHDAGGMFVFPLGDKKLGAAWIFSGTASLASPGPLLAAQRYFASKGFTRSTVRRQAGELTVLKPPASRKDDSPRVLFVAAGFYGAANSPEAADVLLAVQSNRSLAAEPLWQQANLGNGVAVTTTAGEATVVVRPMELWELMRRASDAEKPARTRQPPAATAGADKAPKRDPSAAARHLGFDGIKALAGRVRLSADAGHDWQVQAQLILPRPLAKALRLLELVQGPLPELPDWIGADVTSATLWRWDFPLAIRGFGNLFDEANEPGPDGLGLFEDMLDGLRDDPEGVRVDLRKDVFAELGPDMLSITDRRGARSKEQPHGNRSLYVARVRDVAKVADALARFYGGDKRVEQLTSGNYQVWTVPEGSSLFVEGESDSVVSVRALALGDGQMLFGTDVDQLNSAIADSSNGPRLKDDASWSRLWRDVKERHGPAGSLWRLSRLDQVLQPAYAQATSAERGDDDGPMSALWRFLLFGTADEKVDVPHAAAPQFDRLRVALPPVSTVLSQSREGFSLNIGALGAAESP